MIPLFYGKVEQGKLTLETPQAFKWHLLSLSGEVQLAISKKKKRRTIPQNSFLHGVVFKLISDATGYDIQEVKGIIKWKFKVKNTSQLSTVENEELCEKIRRWCVTPEDQGGSGLDLQIPFPGEIAYIPSEYGQS